MSYLTSQTDAGRQTVDLLSGNGALFSPQAPTSTEAKWPLWWSVLGVTAFCAAFWTIVLNLLF